MNPIDTLEINSNSSIREALLKLNDNGYGVCFVTSQRVLVGVLTDGDIRRYLLNNNNLDCEISKVMNRDFFSLPVESDEKTIRRSFSSEIKIIPLCDKQGLLVDYADSFKNHRIPVIEPEFNGQELNYLEDCIKSTWISSQGAYVRRFEMMFEDMHPGMHAIAVSNGTVALHLALKSLGVSDGDEVIVPDLTFAATVNAVLYCNAVPVLCEVDPETWCIDAKEAEMLISERTKAIIPVHLYGQLCEMDAIMDLSKRYNLKLLEDCAESIGSKWKGKPSGMFGDAATFSFFGNKTISTGEGGMLLIRDHNIAKQAIMLRDHGMNPNKRYWHDVVGFNYRLTNLQAAIGVAQMERLDEFIAKKRKIASIYKEHLKHIDCIEKFPIENIDNIHSHWLYTVILRQDIDRDRVIDLLMEAGVEARPVFYSMHIMPPYKSFKKSAKLTNSLFISKQGISFPSSVGISFNEIKHVCDSLIRILGDLK